MFGLARVSAVRGVGATATATAATAAVANTTTVAVSYAVSSGTRRHMAAIPVQTDEFHTAEDIDYARPQISVVGVGGAGGNAVNNMIVSGLEGCHFIVANTDAQALSMNLAETHIQLGSSLTQGLGAGANPSTGAAAAEESVDDMLACIAGSHMCFIAAGLGGGTGTGAAPVVARAAREAGVLTVGVATLPFQFEGKHRMQLAMRGLGELEAQCDSLLLIPNQNLYGKVTPQTTLADAFKMCDTVLSAGVRSITDLMVNPGLVNVDYADVRTIMVGAGRAMMGTGEAAGEDRAAVAATNAINNELLANTNLEGASGVLINICGGSDMSLHEVNAAAEIVQGAVRDDDCNVIFGTSLEEGMDGKIRVSVVATGLSSDVAANAKPRKGFF